MCTIQKKKTLLEKIAMYVLKEIPHFVDLIHVSKLHRNGTLVKPLGSLLKWKTTLLEDDVAYSRATIILEGFQPNQNLTSSSSYSSIAGQVATLGMQVHDAPRSLSFENWKKT